MNYRNLCSPLLCVFFVLSTSVMSQADMIDYGDFVGDDVEFSMVTEIATPLPPGGLFGTPTVDGNSLDFLAPGFMSESTTGGLDFLNGRLTFVIEAADGFVIESVELAEFGSFFDFGPDSLSSIEAVAFVESDGQLFSETFEFENLGTNSGAWSEQLVIDGFTPAQSVRFTLDNRLFTLADANGVAFIDKTGVSISVNVTDANVIPEPGASLLAGALLGVAALRRRRSK